MTEAMQEVEQPKLDGKAAEFVDWIETISVLELSKLVKALETRLGVSAAAPVAVAAAPAGGAAPAAEEKTEFTVVLAAVGGNKIAVIKELRVLTSLGLKEAKDLVDGAPKTIKDGATKDEAADFKSKLEAAGAKVEVK